VSNHEVVDNSVPYPRPRATDGWSTLAFGALVLSLLFPIAGIVCGHIALSKINRHSSRGRRVAIAALIIGYAYVAVLAVLLTIILIDDANTGYSSFRGGI
jgi:ABC-type sugar transport system permease subunit